MNYFTKEELEETLICIQAVRKSSTISEMLLGDLYEKIESMIDNYCDHQEYAADHNYEVQKCKKCEALFL